MAEVLARLWAKFLPEIEQRVAVLDAAARALEAGTLSDELREAAHAAAHKLAGSLGTFGLQRGTEVARRAEELTAAHPEDTDAAELGACVAALREIVATRDSG
jgi:HPt (histidine-containing phosphotransfer) domain-containing protein